MSSSVSNVDLGQSGAGSVKSLSLDDCWTVLASSFLRGALGFFKNGAGSATTVSLEIRSGISMVRDGFKKSSWVQVSGMNFRHTLSFSPLLDQFGWKGTRSRFSRICSTLPDSPRNPPHQTCPFRRCSTSGTVSVL